MSSSRLLSLLHLLSLSLLFQLALGDGLALYTCYGSGNFTPNGTYNKNLDNLFTFLDSETPLTGFASSSQGLSQNETYGFALCRGDLNTTDCQACVDKATNEIQEVCQFKNEGFQYNDVCKVKYSNISFLGSVSTKVWTYILSTNNASDPVSFNRTVIDLVSQLKELASDSPKLYAAGDQPLATENSTVYGFVQCTRDISAANCSTCIDFAIKVVVADMYGREGGRFIGENCDIRYEIYPFLLG